MDDVQIQNAEKPYGDTKVLNDISIDIKDVEFLVLVGPSGCGNSTLLCMVAGLESFTGGHACIGDRDITELPEPQHRMVFQNYALYPHMAVERNMGFSLEIKSLPRDQRRAEVKAADARS